MSRKGWLLIVIVSALLAVGATLFIMQRSREAGPAAPAFVLRDQQNRLTSLAEFRGKVVVLTFVDPECTQMCPLTTESMVEALKILGPAAASHVQLLGVDVNIEKAKVADVADYTRAHQLQGRWRFLTGSPAQLKSVWRAYHVYVAQSNGDVEHSTAVYLIDSSGHERFKYSTPMSYQAVGDQAQELAKGIAQLLPSHPAISLPTQASEQPEAQPNSAEAVSLPPLGAKRQPVLIGSSHPHLMLFFAGWLWSNADLAKNLATLDSYAALARRRDWPSPVAVDELTIEPSPAEARQTLTPLAATLHTPIVEDASGWLADHYEVGDLPWFVLISTSGKILWSHDGWLSSADLNRDVRSALPAH
ncbi:MAG TPA: SCO family protein [Terriglobia bacterium]|nr:SCO family protein [Terriglobia bacterium]